MAAPALKSSAIAAVGSAAAAVGYATVIERNAFVVREVTMPVLTRARRHCGCCTSATSTCAQPSATSRPGCGNWPAGADLVVNTGDNLAHPKAVPSVVQSLGTCCRFRALRVRQQ